MLLIYYARPTHASFSCFEVKFKNLDLKRTNSESVFPGYVANEPSIMPQPDLSEFKLEELAWLSVGQLILDLYETFEKNNWPKHTAMTLNDFTSKPSINNVKKHVVESESQIGGNYENVLNDAVETHASPIPMVVDSDDEKENSNSNDGAKGFDQQIILSADGSAEDSDATKQSDVSNKPKQSRRRGSDLRFLEQWGWHKAKKPHVQRKKNADQNDAEASINGILRRILSKYFE